jgi:hypothetical protein
VQTHQINISHGRDNVHEIRRELFAFSEILDVFVTARPDSLVVVCAGRPRPSEWLRALRAAGYQVPTRRHLSAAAGESRPPQYPSAQPSLRASEPPNSVPSRRMIAWPPPNGARSVVGRIS